MDSPPHSMTGGPLSTSRSLLQRAQARDPLAWEKMASLYAPLVWHWCRKLHLPAQDCADVFQDVFQSVATHFSTFHRDRPGDSFRGWLRTITKNKVLDHFRKRQQHPPAAGGTIAHDWWSSLPDFDRDMPEGDRETDQVLYRRALELIRSEFAENTWKAFSGIVLDGRSPQEMADELGMSPGAVRVSKCRVLQRLRHEFGDLSS